MKKISTTDSDKADRRKRDNTPIEPNRISFWPARTFIKRFSEQYVTETTAKLKLIDAYLLYVLLTGIIQFVYCCLGGTFPFNAFLSGFISSVGSFALAGKHFEINSKT